jgi:catechol 2,3-dioxygenase-like lactoylglutathione lyase family enzyme
MSHPLPPSFGLRHAALRVRDLKAAEAFYCGQLGFHIEWRPDPDNLYLTLRGDSLALHAGEPARHGALDHLGLAFEKPSHVDAWVAALEKHGVKVLEAPRAHRDGAYSATVADPEGNAVQLICHPPIVEFEAQLQPAKR